jgi:hypothetical protein
MLIVARRNKYNKSNQSEDFRYIYIGYGYMIDLKNNIQFQANNPENQR